MLPSIMLVFIICLIGFFILFVFLQKPSSEKTENSILTKKELKDVQKNIKQQ